MTKVKDLTLRFRSFTLVELLRRRSKQPHLWRTTQHLQRITAKAEVRTAKRSAQSRPHRLDMRIDPERRAALVADYERGTETSELQTIYGLSKGSVRKILNEAGIKLHRTPLTADQRAECHRLRAQGLTQRKIAAQLGVPKTTVQDAVAKGGQGSLPPTGSHQLDW